MLVRTGGSAAPEYSMYECQSFIEGLKVGARLVMELWED